MAPRSSLSPMESSSSSAAFSASAPASAACQPAPSRPHPAPEPGASRWEVVSLTNIGSLLHELGDPRLALQHYQKAVELRMETIQIEQGGRQAGGRPFPTSAVDEATRQARCCQLAREEATLRRSLEERSSGPCGGVAPGCPAGVDMYQQFETRRDENDPSFHAASSPIRFDSAFDANAGSVRRQQLEGWPWDDNFESGITIYNMGLSHLVAGSLAKASQLFEMSLKVISGRVRSPAEVAFAAAASLNAARVEYRRGVAEEAFRHVSDSLQLWKGLLSGPRVPGFDEAGAKTGIADALSLLGRMHHEAGSTAKALGLCREALRLRRSALGDDHVAVASTLYNIGLVLQSDGKLEDAIEHVRWFVDFAARAQAQADAAASSGPGGPVPSPYAPHLAESLHVLGILHLESDSVTKAIDCLTKSLEVRRSLQGRAGDSASAASQLQLSTVDTLCALGRIMQDSGRYDQALLRYTEALQIETSYVESAARSYQSDRGNGDDDAGEVPTEEGIATVLCSIGQVHQSLGRLDDATRCYERVLAISRALLGDEDEFVANMLNVLGNVHLERGDAEGAVSRFAEAARILRRAEADRQRSQDSGAGDDAMEASPSSQLSVVLGLAGAVGIEFHPHAAAA